MLPYENVVIRIDLWAIACFAPKTTVREDHIWTFISRLSKIGSHVGMPMISHPCFCKYATSAQDVEPLFMYLKKTFEALQLIIIILPGMSPVYGEVNRVVKGMLVSLQHVQARSVIKSCQRVLTNLCIKIKGKLGGINSILFPNIWPKVFTEPVIFFGCDVTHPQPDDHTNPSVAAVVGSMDAHPSRYAATVRVQTPRQEVIQDLSSMIRDLLIKFYKSTGGYKPKRLVLYRHGISEGQIFYVAQQELAAIREACFKLEENYRPAITFIVVQKRLHTKYRVYCMDKQQQFDNVAAGTIALVRPTAFDFFLCSHEDIQGTGRLSHYRVMWDDSRFYPEELQSLTLKLCYTYVRSIRSYSIPVPAYYAHLVSFRSLHHFNEKKGDNNEEDIRQSDCIEKNEPASGIET